MLLETGTIRTMAGGGPAACQNERKQKRKEVGDASALVMHTMGNNNTALKPGVRLP
jgi:hypothetical protein